MTSLRERAGILTSGKHAYWICLARLPLVMRPSYHVDIPGLIQILYHRTGHYDGPVTILIDSEEGVPRKPAVPEASAEATWSKWAARAA